MNRMKTSLFLRYLAIVSIPILVLLLMGTVSVIINQRYAARQIQESSTRTLVQIRNSMDFEQSRILATIQDFVNVSAYARPYVESIYVYIQNSGERLLATTGGIVELGMLNDREWFDSFRRHPEDDLFWTETRVLQRLPAVESGRPVISIFRRLSPMIGVRVPGVVVSNIYRDRLESFLEQLKGSPDQRIVILDDAGEVVFGELESYVAGADDRYRSSSS